MKGQNWIISLFQAIYVKSFYSGSLLKVAYISSEFWHFGTLNSFCKSKFHVKMD